MPHRISFASRLPTIALENPFHLVDGYKGVGYQIHHSSYKVFRGQIYLKNFMNVSRVHKLLPLRKLALDFGHWYLRLALVDSFRLVVQQQDQVWLR